MPAVDAVVEALAKPADPLPALGQLGRSRAEAGVGIEEALDDLGTLSGVLGHRPEHAGLVRAVAVGWAEVAVAGRAGWCQDPFTQLTTPDYLATRLGEVYREASRVGIPAEDSHALVVVGLDRVEPGADRLVRQLVAAECLRATFSGGETLCAAGPGHVVALVVRDHALSPRIAVLRELLAEQLAASHPARVWRECLPRHERLVSPLLAELAR